MRLTEALVKDLFGRCIEKSRVDRLQRAFMDHLDIEDRFVLKQGEKGWNKVSMYGYECCRLARVDESGKSAIERVLAKCGRVSRQGA